MWKNIFIFTSEMASPGNQHCANCIGTLSFPIEGKCPACTYPSFTLYTVQRWLNIQRTNGLRFKFVRIDSFLHSALWRIGSPSNSYPGFRAGWNSVTLVGQKQWRRQGGGGSFPLWVDVQNYVICVCFHCHGTFSHHTTNTLQGRRAKSHVDTQTIQPGLGDFVL